MISPFKAKEWGHQFLTWIDELRRKVLYNDSDQTLTGDLTVDGDVLIPSPTVPSSASDTGTVGTISWDASYIYICTATDTWKRVAISTW